MFGTAPLPGHVALDNLPPGSVVLAHSACLHGRRPRPGPGPRYFVDVSYCEHVPPQQPQQAGPAAVWCSYPNSEDSLAVHATISAAALAAGHGREGQYDWLYDTRCFYDQSRADTLQASHSITAEGHIRRAGMSTGQEEAANAARKWARNVV